MTDDEKQVLKLIHDAAVAAKSEDAVRLSQAALNAAHALQVLEMVVSKHPCV